MLKRVLYYLVVCLLFNSVCRLITPAQSAGSNRLGSLTITASVTGDHVRFAALSEVTQLRLEVLAVNGEKVFDSGFQAGNLFDWNLYNQAEQLLPDGTYQCLVTARDFAGRLVERRGKVLLQAGQVTLETGETIDGALAAPNPVSALERPDFLALLTKETTRATTLILHDGKEGRLVSSSGGLSFRTGDFFAGNDVEQVRLTPEGNLGLGVRAPQARLDVAGLIRTSEGIQFPDGSIQTTAASAGVSANATTLRVANKSQSRLAPDAPAGTVNALAKFVSANTLDDSSIFEVGGNIGVGTATPGGVFDLQRASSGDLLQRFWNTGSGGAKLRYVSQTGASAQIQLTDLAEWLSAIAGNNTIGLQFRVRDAGAPNTEAALEASARMTILRNGNVGIGTTTPGFPLSVAGIIHSSNGGFRFPDGSVQTTAATGGGTISGVTAGTGLTGGGTTGTVTLSIAAGGVSTNELAANAVTTAKLADTNVTDAKIASVAGNKITGAIPVTSVPAGSANYIQNSTNPQAGSNFNISGTGTAATLNAMTVNATTLNAADVQGTSINTTGGSAVGRGYRIGDILVLRSPGNNSLYVGYGAGTNVSPPDNGSSNTYVGVNAGATSTGGGGNTYIGRSAGLSDITGVNNTMIGLNTSVGAETNRQNATAIGAYAQANCNHCLVLGSVAGVNGGDATVKVGIGLNNPTERLHVGGNILATGTITPSDQRYKQNIFTLRGALETVQRLRGVSYDWNQAAFPAMHFETGRQLGFIAQEVEAVLPEAVHKSSDGMYALNYSSVIPLLVEAIKEQELQSNRQLEQLQAENGALKAKNAEIETRLVALEKLLLQMMERNK